MPRVVREEQVVATPTQARAARDKLAAMGEVAATFEAFRPQAEVIHNVEAVPTIFPWYDHITQVGGHPISRFTLVHGPSNEGKAFSDETLVLTPTGWVPIAALKCGDFVIGSDGAATEVVGVYPQGEKELFRVTFSDGVGVECCDEHLWYTTTARERNRERNRGRYVRGPRPERSRIATGVDGAGSVKCLATIRETLGDEHAIPVLDGHVQYSPLGGLPVDPYVLGLLLGDGSLVGTSPTFCNPERDLALALKARLLGGDAITWLGDGMGCRLVGCATKRELMKLGVWGCRAWEKHVPELYLRAAPEDRLALLRGLIDTDGSVDKDGVAVEYSTTSFVLAAAVAELARSLGAIVHQADRQTSYTYKGEQLVGRPSARLKIVFNNGVVPVSSQKHLSRWRGRGRTQYRRIVSIVPTRRANATCIAVAAKDRLYVVEGFVVTHNTLFTLGLLASFLRRYHFAGLVDAERTTTQAWVRQAMGDELAAHPGFTALPVGTYEQVRAGVRDWAEKIATARAQGKLDKDTTGLVVVDSIRKLFPKKLWDELAKAVQADEDDAKPKGGKWGRGKRKDGIDGMGGRAGQIKASFNAAWVDELIPLLADTRTAMVVIARETKDVDADMFASKFEGKDYKIGGGTALFYEASLDIRVTRSWVRVGDEIIGEKHRLELHKTKVANKDTKVPFAYFHTSNPNTGRVGFEPERDLVDLGVEIGAITTAGGWFSLGKVKLGQGVENVIAKLKKDEQLRQAVEQQVRALSAKTYVESTQL